MKKFLTLIALAVSLHSFAQEKWDLRKCVDYALQNNISVRQADVQARLSKLLADQSKMTRLPNANATVGTTYQHGLNINPTTNVFENIDITGGNLGFNTSYTIFNWYARKNNIAANVLTAKADELNIEKTRNDLALTVANGFLQVMLRKEQARLSEVQLKQSQEQLRNTRKFVEAGSQPELNAIQIEAQVERDSATYIQALAGVEQGLINLKAFMNFDFAQPFDIVYPDVDRIPVENLLDLSPQSVYDLAITNQPQQKVTALRIESSQKLVTAARGAMYPTLTASGTLNTRFANNVYDYRTQSLVGPTGAYAVDNLNKYPVYAPQFQVTGIDKVSLGNQLNRYFGQSLGLNLNVPLFNAHQSRAQWERAKINVRQNQLQDDQEKQTLRANIYNAYQDAYSALQKLNSSRKSVQVSEKAMDYAQKRYDVGLLGTLDLITTRNNVFTAKIQELSNHYEYVFKLKVLEFYKGQGIKL
ncbi:MAG: TolC family protein [Chitinophagaceae bacterium]|nr:TolC family protein [Chitinophagaceae bacterium]